MNGSGNSSQGKIRVSTLIEFLALTSTVFIIALFAVGHLSASIYFSSLEIDYFKYADTDTAFRFAIQTTEAIFAFLASIGFAIALFAVYVTWFANKQTDEKTATAKLFLFTLVGIFVVLFVISFLWSDIDSSKSIENRLYIPYEVKFNQNKDSLFCVKTIGTIGVYQVFVNENLQPVMLPTKSITAIKQMFRPVPVETRGSGQGTSFNRNYREELQQWNAKWEDSCSGEYKFEVFDFNNNFQGGPPR